MSDKYQEILVWRDGVPVLHCVREERRVYWVTNGAYTILLLEKSGQPHSFRIKEVGTEHDFDFITTVPKTRGDVFEEAIKSLDKLEKLWG